MGDIESQQHQFLTTKKIEEPEEYFVEILAALKAPIDKQTETLEQLSPKASQKTMKMSIGLISNHSGRNSFAGFKMN